MQTSSRLLQLGLGVGYQEGALLQCSEGSASARAWEELHTQGTCRKAFSLPLSTVSLQKGERQRREALLPHNTLNKLQVVNPCGVGLQLRGQES